jgi:hypothetical protein
MFSNEVLVDFHPRTISNFKRERMKSVKEKRALISRSTNISPTSKNLSGFQCSSIRRRIITISHRRSKGDTPKAGEFMFNVSIGSK